MGLRENNLRLLTTISTGIVCLISVTVLLCQLTAREDLTGGFLLNPVSLFILRSTADSNADGSHESYEVLESKASAEIIVMLKPELEARDASSCEKDAQVCLYGEGLTGAPVMSPAHFFIKLLRPDDCYVRAVGEVGIILGKITEVEPGLLRVDYTGQQVGEYELWVSCSSTPRDPNFTTLPIGSLFMPWLWADTVPGCPSKLTIWSDGAVPRRGCRPCRDPNSANFPGQWVAASVLREECGEAALGAIDEWVDDKWVWAPHECVFPFVSRNDFLEHFNGSNFILVGDSMVRGTMCDLYNWLYKGYGSEMIQGPYTYNHTTRLSSWDGLVCGFNLPPQHENLQLVDPNPFTVGGVRVEYREALNVNEHGVVAHNYWTPENPQYRYTLLLLHLGLWGMNEMHRYATLPAFMKRVISRYLCRPKGGVPPSDEAIFMPSFTSPEQCNDPPYDCTWRDADAISPPIGDCDGSFPGRIVLRGTMGKFRWEETCVDRATDVGRGYCCIIDKQMMGMAREAFKVNDWDSILLMDTMNVTYSRPDRSIDSFHYFARKCSSCGRPCTLDDVEDPGSCCFMANFPEVGSMTVTNMMLNLIWDDPLLQKGAEA